MRTRRKSPPVKVDLLLLGSIVKMLLACCWRLIEWLNTDVAARLSAGPLLVWQSLSRWTWWRGSWGGRGRRSAARRTTPLAWCTCAACSPSCATRLATWPRRSRRRSSTWCSPFLTGWVTAWASGLQATLEKEVWLHRPQLAHYYRVLTPDWNCSLFT